MTIKARNSITWCNQYVAHRDVKVNRRNARKEIEFEYEIFEPKETITIPVRFEFLPNDDSDFYIPEQD